MANRNEEVFYKSQLRQNFDSAAWSYEENAILQKYTAAEMLDRMRIMNIRPKMIMDLGSGTGEVSARMDECYPNATTVQVDISINMLRAARERLPGKQKSNMFLCADAEKIPFVNNAFDLVVSNLMLQWGENFSEIFSDVYGALKPGGVFVFTSLGPSTLLELRNAWKDVDEYKHVNEFVDMHILGDLLISSGLADPVMEADSLVMNYQSVPEIMQHLKSLGAHNVNYGRRNSLTGKGRLVGLNKAYESMRTREGLPCSYEVIYGHAWKPETGVSEKGSQTHTFSLASLKETLARFSGK